jgi:hypothetical protein
MKGILKVSLYFIFAAFSTLVGFLVGISLQSEESTDSKNDSIESYPNSYIVSAPQDINDGNSDNLNSNHYKLVFETDDEVLKLLNNGDLITINLNRRRWKNINFSPNGTKIALLGQSDGIYDIFVYDIDSLEWGQLTFYSFNSLPSVRSFLWFDDVNILFTQGEKGDVWLHRLNLDSNEILKISKVNGDLVDLNLEKNRLIFQDDNSGFFIATIDGALMYKISDKHVKNMFFTQDDNVIFVNYENENEDEYGGNIGYMLLGSQEVDFIESMAESEILCKNDTVALAIKRSRNLLIKIHFAQRSIESVVPAIDIVKANCSNDLSQAFVMDSSENWFEVNITERSIKEMPEYKGYLDIKLY